MECIVRGGFSFFVFLIAVHSILLLCLSDVFVWIEQDNAPLVTPTPPPAPRPTLGGK